MVLLLLGVHEFITHPDLEAFVLPRDVPETAWESTAAVEIRRIHEADANVVVDLWDRMCREARDGGPLREAGRRNLARMLAMSAWHRETFCLVAVRGDEPLGFALAYLDTGDGLLPGVLGQVQEFYVRPDLTDAARLRVMLARAVVVRLRELGASTLRKLVAADEPEEQQFWASMQFEPDMVVMSNYEQAHGDCP